MLDRLHDKLTKPVADGEYSFGLLTDIEYRNLFNYTLLLMKLFSLPERVLPVLMICLVDTIDRLCLKAFYKELIAQALGRDAEYVKEAIKQLVKHGLLISLNAKESSRCAKYRFNPSVHTFGGLNTNALGNIKSIHIKYDLDEGSYKVEIDPICNEEKINDIDRTYMPIECDEIEI